MHVEIAYSCDHLEDKYIFRLVISAVEESQITSSDSELGIYDDPSRGEKTRRK